MKRKIPLVNSQLLIQTDENDYVPFISIKRAYFDNNVLQSIVEFSMWDDFEFNAYTNKANVKELTFTFNDNDPFYSHLTKLLGADEKIIIDDDHTFNTLQKFMSIEKIKNKIVITFTNSENCKLSQERFNIFIKNIGPDARSKMQNLNLKIRLIQFFKDCKNILLKEENRGIGERGTFEELEI